MVLNCIHKGTGSRRCGKPVKYRLGNLYYCSSSFKAIVEANPEIVPDEIYHNFCQVPNCPNRPTYGYYNHKNRRTRIFCSEHYDKPEVVNPVLRNIENKNKLFNKKKNDNRLENITFNDIILLGSKKCINKIDGVYCNTDASYNYKNETEWLYCEKCAFDVLNDTEENPIKNIRSIKCIYIKENGKRCTTQPSFNIEGKHGGKYCKMHGELIKQKIKKESNKDVNIVYNIGRKCKGLDEFDKPCGIQPFFGEYGDKYPSYCNKHAIKHCKNPVNVVSKKCNYAYCKKRARCGYPGGKPIRCNNCIGKGMINLIDKSCCFISSNGTGCTKQPHFGLPGSSATYCRDHATDDMIDVKNRKCYAKGCSCQPNFNFPYEKKGKYCSEHAQGEVDDNGIPMINVLIRYCNHPGCQREALYGYIFETKTRCSDHILYDKEFDTYMMKGNLNPKCELCDRPAICSYSDKLLPTRCDDHMDNGQQYINYRPCPECKDQPSINRQICKICKNKKFEDHNIQVRLFDMIPDNKNNIYLSNGNIKNKISKYNNKILDRIIKKPSNNNNEPDSPKVLNKKIKSKEIKVKNMLDNRNIEYHSHDRSINIECSKKRPDFILFRRHNVIIIEVDENQHKYYNCECEQKRMVEIYNACDSRPVIFIRFNPDKYNDNNGNLITSYSGREDKLEEIINNVCDKDFDEGLYVYYMYFNGCDGETFEEINISCLVEN